MTFLFENITWTNMCHWKRMVIMLLPINGPPICTFCVDFQRLDISAVVRINYFRHIGTIILVRFKYRPKRVRNPPPTQIKKKPFVKNKAIWPHNRLPVLVAPFDVYFCILTIRQRIWPRSCGGRVLRATRRTGLLCSGSD